MRLPKPSEVGLYEKIDKPIPPGSIKQNVKENKKENFLLEIEYVSEKKKVTTYYYKIP